MQEYMCGEMVYHRGMLSAGGSISAVACWGSPLLCQMRMQGV